LISLSFAELTNVLTFALTVFSLKTAFLPARRSKRGIC